MKAEVGPAVAETVSRQACGFKYNPKCVKKVSNLRHIKLEKPFR